MADLRNTFVNLAWRLISGPVLFLSISKILSPIYQGYWFTFVSFAALCALADLGFTTVVLQFSANRFAKLKFCNAGFFYGNAKSLADAAALLLFSVKWILCLSAVGFPLIWGVGFYFLSQYDAPVEWKLPWFIYSVGSIFSLISNVFLSFLEGCDSVAKIQKCKLLSAVVSVVVALCALLLGLNLYALAFSVVISCIVSFLLIWLNFKRPIIQLFRLKGNLPYSEIRKIRHILFRYAISFASGYFIFQAFTPIAFYFYGPVEAGQVGLSLAIWMAILNISKVWLVAVTPKFNIFAANRQFQELFELFQLNFWCSVGTYLIGAVIFIGVLASFQSDFVVFNRLLDLPAQLQLALIFLSQVLIGGLATYVRAFLKEPFALMSFLTALFTTLCSICVGINFDVDYLFSGMLLSYVVSVPLTYSYFKVARAST